VATPIIQSTGSVSGAGTAGQGRNDLVPGETVTLSDTEAGNAGASYFWVFDDTPIGTAPTLLNPTTATPSFVVDADPALAGSYRVRYTVDGAFVSVEVIAVPLETLGSRIPSFEEETQYDKNGNLKGWHEALTAFMRSTDDAIGDLGSTAFERTAAAVVPNGTNSIEIELGAVVYPGSLLALAVRGDEAVTGGAVNVSARINGLTKFTATMNVGSPSDGFSVQLPGVYPVVQGDRLSVTVAGAALVTGSTNPLPVSVVLVASNTLDVNVVSFPNASNTQKGITKLSVAPAISTEPVAAGTNDNRIPTQAENDALVGTNGAPSSSNKYVTNSDPRLAAGIGDSGTATIDTAGTYLIASLTIPVPVNGDSYAVDFQFTAPVPAAGSQGVAFAVEAGDDAITYIGFGESGGGIGGKMYTGRAVIQFGPVTATQETHMFGGYNTSVPDFSFLSDGPNSQVLPISTVITIELTTDLNADVGQETIAYATITKLS